MQRSVNWTMADYEVHCDNTEAWEVIIITIGVSLFDCYRFIGFQLPPIVSLGYSLASSMRTLRRNVLYRFFSLLVLKFLIVIPLKCSPIRQCAVTTELSLFNDSTLQILVLKSYPFPLTTSPIVCLRDIIFTVEGIRKDNF